MIAHCDYCGAELEIQPCHQHKRWHFCNQECHNKFESFGPHKTGSYYTCEQCGKEVWKTPAEVARTEHVFCSTACAGLFRRNRIVQICPTCGQEFESVKADHRIYCSRSCAMRMVESRPQQIVNEWLDANGIKYERERYVRGVQVDNYLVDYDLIIEVNGDYWHCNPERYDHILYEHQINGISRDRFRSEKIHSAGIPVLYLWECDINGDPDKCKALIASFVENRGLLREFHSFNYVYLDLQLHLRSNRIVPYSEYDPQDLPVCMFYGM